MQRFIFSTLLKSMLVKTTIVRVCTVLMLAGFLAGTQILAMAVIAESIAEMNCSYPAPHNPPLCPQDNSCSVAHQGLQGELVYFLEENGECAKVAYDTNIIVYGFDKETQEPLNTFWVNKKYIELLADLPEELVCAIPNPQYAHEPTVRLMYPWYDSEGRGFSVGTRFKHISDRDSEDAYAVIVADYREKRLLYDYVPRTDAILEKQHDTLSQRKLFVKNIKGLIDRVAASGLGRGCNYVIAYGWGRCSFLEPYVDAEAGEQPSFYVEEGVWQRVGPNAPYTGYDCSQFVRQMAQSAGIYFPWKTTTVIERSKRALGEEDELEEGDLIWVPGHIMIVLKNNEIAEARGYVSGYGCVHRIPLSECFAEVSTHKELLEHYRKGGTLRFKNRQGEIQEGRGPTNFKLLKLVD